VRQHRDEVQCSKTIRRSGLGRRETSGPSVMPGGALDSVGRPRSESCEREPGTREVRVHTVRLGGRHRSDASRVFSTGRSQGLLVNREGASQEEVRSSTDAEREWAEGESVRARFGFLQVPERASCGFTLAGSRDDGRRFWARARPGFTARAKLGPLARRSTPHHHPRGA